MNETKLLVDIVTEASKLSLIEQAMTLGFVIALANDVAPKEE